MTESVETELQAGESAMQVQSLHVGGPSQIMLWMWLIAPILVLLLALLLQADEGRLIQLRGISVPLPEICTFQRTTRIDCPGCGLTRSFIALVRGDVPMAWTLNKASPVVFAFVLLQIPLATLRLLQPGLSWNHRLAKLNLTAMILVAFLIFAQWIYRFITGDLV